MYLSAYNKLFWGFILVVFNINLGPIDILPNFIGYFLICSGVCTLASQNKAFNKATIPSAIMGILSFKDAYKIQPASGFQVAVQNQSIPWIIYDGVALIISIYVVFCVVRGIYLTATERGLQELRERAKVRWRAYFITSSVMGFATPFLLNISSEWYILYFIWIFITFVAGFFIIGLMRIARNELGNDTVDNVDNHTF